MRTHLSEMDIVDEVNGECLSAFFIYASSGGMDWAYGLTLALGTALGARFGAKKVVQHKKANAITRKVLIAVIILAILKMFQPYIASLI